MISQCSHTIIKINTRSVNTRHSWIIILFVFFTFNLNLIVAQDINTLSQHAHDQIRSICNEKASWTPIQRKIGSRLLMTMKRQLKINSTIDDHPQLRAAVPIINSRSVMVDITAQVSNSLLEKITTLGGTVLSHYAQYHTIRAQLPLSQLETLAAEPEVSKILPADQWLSRKVNTSQGDTAHRASHARQNFSVSGAGVKVGVLSDGVDTLTARQSSGDLPALVTILPNQQGNGDEGTAMLEIVHDLAPGASLYFATAGNSQAQFAANILALQTAGCKVIVDDIFFFAEPVFQDGIIAQAVNTVTANGAIYFSATGNEGNLDHGTAGVWEGNYTDSGQIFDYGDGFFGHYHRFDNTNISNRLTANAPYAVVLHWSDPVDASSNDYDLFLMDSTLSNVLDVSADYQNGNDDPFEIIGPAFTNERLVIINFNENGPQNARYLHLNTIRGKLAIPTNGQISGHPAALGAMAVAAVNANHAGGTDGGFNGSETVESFSSDGPRRVFYHQDGTPITPGNFLATGGEVRQKPDISAADGVAVATPGFNPFFGTSAAAPHAAAIAALIISQGKAVTPNAVRTAMNSTAIDIEAPGYDRNSGFGIVNALTAVGYPPCEISAISAGTQSACQLETNIYTQNLTITYTNQPGIGDLIVNGQSFALTTSPQTVTLNNLSANGLPVDVIASFSNDSGCSYLANDLFIAPTACNVCNILSISAGTQSTCNPATNTYTQALTIFYHNPPVSGTLRVNGQTFAITTSPQTVTLTNLTANGANIDVTADFSAIPGCMLTKTNVFTAPENCEPCQISQITVNSQTPCVAPGNTYTQALTITYNHPPATGLLNVNGQLFTITSSPQGVILTNLEANGNTVDVTAFFTSEPDCVHAINGLFTAPSNCTACIINDISPGAQSSCNPVDNSYTQALTITYQHAPDSGNLLVNGQSFPITGSPQTITLSNLQANNRTVDVIAEFSANTNCRLTKPALFTAPESCTLQEITRVSVDHNGNLVISDISVNGNNNLLTMSYNKLTMEYRLGDANNPIIENTPNGIQENEHLIRIPKSDFTGKIIILANSGDDTLIIDFSSGVPNPVGGLTFNGGLHTITGDLLKLQGGVFKTVTYRADGNDFGAITLDGFQISYTGLEPIIDLNSATKRTFEFTSSAIRSIRLSDYQTPSDGLSLIDSNGENTFESVIFNSQTSITEINAGNQNNTLIIDGINPGSIGRLFLNGQDGDDIIQVMAIVASNLIVSINGGNHSSGDLLEFNANGGLANNTGSAIIGPFNSIVYDKIESVTIINSAGLYDIPTLSEWGLIILALLIITLGVVFITRYQSLLLFSAQLSPSQTSSARIKFWDPKLFTKIAMRCFGMLLLVISLFAFSGLKINLIDISSSFICVGILSYLIHYVMMDGNHKP